MEIRAENDCVIDLDQEWVSSLRKKVEVLTDRKHRRIEPRTIFRVPAHLRETDPDAYDPKVISIGPYHRGKPRLKAMDDLKYRYLRRILRRNPDVALEDYLKKIKELEACARSSYSEDINMGSNEFVEMMLLDGCFIVELLLMRIHGNIREEEEEEDPILSTTWALALIKSDMKKLENQLPLFLLGNLFNLANATVPNGGDSYSLVINLTLAFFGHHLLSYHLVVPSEEKVPRFYHVLHLFHSCIIPAQSQNGSQSKPCKPSIYPKLVKIKIRLSSFCLRLLTTFCTRPMTRVDIPYSVPCATVLEEAGVKFKRKKGAKSFLDVTFRKGVMEIPLLSLEDNTNTLFRNLIAFEQCYPDVRTHVQAYACSWTTLSTRRMINVVLLHRHGCIENLLGSGDEAADLFNRLCKDVDNDCGYLGSLFKEVEKHCKSKWNKSRAKLMHDYFSNPWSALSLAGALILILLTVIQTVFAVLGYFRPPT